ncbi:MAG TPA: hypothetical protein VFM25_01400 [Verrucomicrobiae bacterium]|nr:hypothetical protein [Verrucomicrobiae bacterium]
MKAIFHGVEVIQEHDANNAPAIRLASQALIDGSQNTVVSYKYDPYGNLLFSSGSLADANKYRFSSKEWVLRCSWSSEWDTWRRQ